MAPAQGPEPDPQGALERRLAAQAFEVFDQPLDLPIAGSAAQSPQEAALASARALLDEAIGRALLRGARLLLVVAGRLRPGADRLTRQTKLLVVRFDIETDLVLQALGRR